MIYVSTDINECMEYDDLCAVNATCTNTIGTYQCYCDTGFTGDGVSCSESYFDYCVNNLSHVENEKKRMILYLLSNCNAFNWTTLSLLYIIIASTACTDGEVLLYNGSHVSPNFTEGTVLVCYNDSYGTVCDDYWDELEASVVCRQLHQGRLEITYQFESKVA